MTWFKRRADGVVDAAHFNSDGSLAWVRAYERRGPTWSDRVLLDRPALVQRLQQGRRFYLGKRRTYHASEFDLEQPIRLVKGRQGLFVVLGKDGADQDRLEGVPVV